MLKKVFLIGGMSESGKSTAGKYLDSRGIKRLKIVTFLTKVKEAESVSDEFVSWNEKAERERPEWLAMRFVEEFERYCNDQGIKYCCLESLYTPNFAQAVSAGLQGKIVVVFIDISQEIRIMRQMTRENLASVEEARAYIIPRDQKKEEWGTHKVKDIADEIINNAGSIGDLYGMLDAMLARHGVPVVGK